MDARDEPLPVYYGGYGYPTNTVPPPVQPHHPALQPLHATNHSTPLAPYLSHHGTIPNYHSPPRNDNSELHERITPQPKQRRRRGANAAAAALASPGGSEMQTPSRPIRTNPHHGIVVKTKFPVARIKRIMQADEDVGKVAQVTPVIVSKALELFMVSLCAKASEQARSRSSKRITAAHLKQVIGKEEQFDFLQDIMSKVPDIPLPSEGSGHNGDSDEGAASAAAPPGSVKKPRKPRTRKPKDEEF